MFFLFTCSGPDSSNDIVSSAISRDYSSIYCLTKGFQIQQWAIGVSVAKHFSFHDYFNQQIN